MSTETFLNRLKHLKSVVRQEIVEISECWIYDQIGNDGYGVVIFPNDQDAVRSVDIPVGHFPSRTDSGFEPSQAACFGAARVESCFRARDVYDDGSRGPVSNWLVGPET